MNNELHEALCFLIGQMRENKEEISHLLDVAQSQLKNLDSPDFYEPPELVKFISCDTEDLGTSGRASRNWPCAPGCQIHRARKSRGDYRR